MAWGRYYRYGYGRRYRTSVKATTMKRSFKSSAANMTQNGLFNISVRDTLALTITTGNNEVSANYDISAKIAASTMHGQLSNVFDQYKIEKISIKIRPMGTPNSNVYQIFYTCVDRTGFGASVTNDQLKTYQSYKETNWPMNGDTAKTHYVSIGQTDIVGKSTYYDTKGKAAFPNIRCGTIVPGNATADNAFAYSIEIDAQVRYRGVRVDTGSVSSS